jgi:methionyl-tRNA formyltransferase
MINNKKNLQIGYFADGPWAHQALDKILKDNTIRVKFIVPRYDTKDETLQKIAEKNKIDYFKTRNVNSAEFIQKVNVYDCDLFVSMSFNQIFKTEIINIPKLKIINCHAGKLPYYRGRNILNWVLINDEKEFGITVHFVDSGIDTGDILLQEDFPISDMDNYATLLEKAYTGCANILYKALTNIQRGVINTINQDSINPFGLYCGMRKEGDEQINWNQNSRNLFNFVRAICNPGPMATTYLDSDEIKINRAVYFKNAPKYIGIPGQVLVKTKLGFLVKTKDSYIEIQEVYSNRKIRVGDRFSVCKVEL